MGNSLGVIAISNNLVYDIDVSMTCGAYMCLLAHESNREPEAPPQNKKTRLSDLANQMILFS
jgi:hypothetical protein